MRRFLLSLLVLSFFSFAPNTNQAHAANTCMIQGVYSHEPTCPSYVGRCDIAVYKDNTLINTLTIVANDGADCYSKMIPLLNRAQRAHNCVGVMAGGTPGGPCF